MPTPKKNETPTQSPAPSVLVVPRGWLYPITAVLLVPWLVAGSLYLWRPGETLLEAAPAVERLPDTSTSGPGGALIVSPMVIAPPIELIGDNWGRLPEDGRYWFFPDTNQIAVESFLLSAGLSRDQVSRLMATARPEARIHGLLLTPDQELLRGMGAEVRGTVYLLLATSPLNVAQAQAFRFAGKSVDDWLGTAPLSPATRQIIDPLIYRQGQHLYFADVALAQSLITDHDERLRLAQALMRQATVRVRLSITDRSQVPALAAYWGRGGRRTDIRPLLESVVGAGSDRSLDIVHLLPRLARDHLYRYPRIAAEDLDRPALANCLWTALNFFNDQADDRYLDMDVALQHLKQDYVIVQNGFQLGDVMAMLDEQGRIFHAVVYLADDLVFTKNGTSTLAPWVILPIDVVKDYYHHRSESPRLLYHRRKDL